MCKKNYTIIFLWFLIHFIGLAGTPTTFAPCGIDFVTQAPAPMIASSPIVIGSDAVPLIITTPVPMKTLLPICT
jgi:hypothetical protein